MVNMVPSVASVPTTLVEYALVSMCRWDFDAGPTSPGSVLPSLPKPEEPPWSPQEPAAADKPSSPTEDEGNEWLTKINEQ